MKTTLEIDEPKLLRVMKLGGFKTRKEAIDYALSEAERLTHLKNIKSNPMSKATIQAGIVDDYDPIKLRELDKPQHL